jgi:formylglycine-generating enzyme required for sulfatase activity
MIGNVWEWTSSDFLPYPGFSEDPYKEYSSPWFATHKVLRGGALKREGSDLLHVALDGRVDVLREMTGRWFGTPRPAPDDRFLAFGLRTVDSNVWLIETK